jgi:hypothetical protein
LTIHITVARRLIGKIRSCIKNKTLYQIGFCKEEGGEKEGLKNGIN